MMKKIILTVVLVVAYFIFGWVADNISDVVILNGYGVPYTTSYHLFYNEYTFHNDAGVADSNKINLRLERLFLLGTAIVFIGLEILKKSKNK